MQASPQPQVVGGSGGRFNIVVIQNRSSFIRTSYRQIPSYLLGAIQLAIGLICIVVQGIEDAFGGSGSTGIGAGIFLAILYYISKYTKFVITGVLCFWAGKARTTCSIISVIFLSIFSILLAISLMNGAGHGVADHKTVVKVMNIVLIILAAFEGIAAFMSTWLGCSSMCGRQEEAQGVVLSQPIAGVISGNANYAPSLPPGQMAVGNAYPMQQVGVSNAIPVQQSAAPDYGFQPQYIPQSAPMLTPNPPPQYTAPSEPPPSYSVAVPSAPPGH